MELLRVTAVTEGHVTKALDSRLGIDPPTGGDLVRHSSGRHKPVGRYTVTKPISQASRLAGRDVTRMEQP